MTASSTTTPMAMTPLRDAGAAGVVTARVPYRGVPEVAARRPEPPAVRGREPEPDAGGAVLMAAVGSAASFEPTDSVVTAVASAAGCIMGTSAAGWGGGALVRTALTASKPEFT
jgi:hypothetical protein